MKVSVAIALPLAIWFSATGDDPDAARAGALAVGAIGLVAVGLLGGKWSLPMFAAMYAVAATVNQVFFWTDDPKKDGFENFPPAAGIIIILPFLLIAVLAGVVAGIIIRRRATPRLKGDAPPTSNG